MARRWEGAKETFREWIGPMLESIHRQGYKVPNIRRVYIPKPGKTEKRPLGVPTVSDRGFQRSTAEVLSAIYEQDFLPCSAADLGSVPIVPWQPSMR